MHAAAASVNPAAAPAVTYPASAPVTSARYRPAAACSSSMRTHCRAASAIAAATSGAIGMPLSRVSGPAALMMGRTPSSS